MKKIFFLVCIIFSIILSMSFVSAMDVNETQNNAVLKDNVNIIDVGSGDFSQLSHYVKSDNYIILNGDITRSPSNSDLSIEKNVTIDGNGHTINANNLGRIFSIYGGELTLKNLKLKNGNLDGPGGAILNYHGKLTIMDCTFENNRATQGGAISCDVGKTTILGTNVFSNNQATIDAGAIYNYYSELTMSGKNTFNSNQALIHNEGKGGAILNVFGGSKMTITGETIFNNNQATFDGGAIFNHQATLSMDGVNSFINNKLTGGEGKGGAINNENGTFTLSGVNTFKSNSAVRGGAIDSSFDSITTISGKNEFINNKVTGMGGAISNHLVKRFNLYGENTFESNSANNIAGALYIFHGTSDINSKNAFNSNTASNAGGAIYLDSASMTIKGFNNFKSNSAPLGGALLLKDSTRVDILGENVFDSNTASSTGGAIRANNVKELILGNHNYFSNNKASSSGGAIYMQNSVLNTQGALYESNSAQYGGAIFLENTAFAGNYNIFKNNYASKTGSDIESYQSSINSLEYNYWNSQNKVSQNNIHNYDVSRIRNWVVIDFTIPSEIKQNTNTEVVRFKTNSFTNLGGEMPMYGVSASPNFNPSNVIIKNNVGTSQYTGPAGPVTVTVSSSNFGGSKIVNVVEGKVKTQLKGNNVVLKDPSQSANYQVTLSDVNGNVLSGKTVTITADGKKYTKTTDAKGIVSLTLSGLANGYHKVESSYAGENKYYDSSTTNGIICAFNNESTTQLQTRDIEMYFKDGTRYGVKLMDSAGKALANKEIYILISGIIYTRTTNENGEASIAINLNSGTHDVMACFPGDASNEFAFVENTIIVKPTISGNDITKHYKNGTQYYAKFVGKDGKALTNTKIKYNINGVFYERTTDANGYAKMNINLIPGRYVITATNPVNGEMYSNIVTVLTIFEGKDVVKYYRNDTQYIVKILGDDGKPKSGVTVSFNINGVFYNRVTNESGYAKMNLNLIPGDYIITAEYNGLRYSNNIKILPVLSARDVTMSYRDGTKFEVKVLDGQGNAYPNQNITFNINGVFYQKVTDDDGYARLNINLMPGEYIITSEYGTARIANKINIR
jgi:predicted outer membrane repeat protein